MPKFIIRLFAALICTAVYAGSSSAGPGGPLVPPLTGFVPPSTSAMACERYVNKRVALFPLDCALKCTIAKATTLSKNLSFDSTLCEETASFSCKAQYDRAMAALDPGLCLGCLSSTVRQALYPSYRSAITSINGLVYCDATNSVPLGDGGGFVSLNKDITKCENAVARNLFKAVKCLNLHCHQKTTEAMFYNKPANNNVCEDQDPLGSCEQRFLKSTANLVGCPACLDAPSRLAIFDALQQDLDSRNGDIYCSDNP
jgi:hypothetical protein